MAFLWGILHELKKASFCDFSLIKYIKYLEYELHVIFPLHIDEILNNFEVTIDEDRHREIVKFWRQNVCDLICDFFLVTLFEKNSKLSWLFKTSVGRYFIKIAQKTRVSFDVKLYFFVPKRFGLLLLYIFLLFDNYTAARITLIVGLPVWSIGLCLWWRSLGSDRHFLSCVWMLFVCLFENCLHLLLCIVKGFIGCVDF